MLEFTLLGTGSSGGVPRIGNDWGNCDPQNPKNRRRRCAMLIRQRTDSGETTVLVDTGADMREQLLSENVQQLDGVVLTHSHADHIFGLDDLRQLWVKHRKPVDVYFDSDNRQRILAAFGYCFEQPEGSSYPPFCVGHILTSCNRFGIDGSGGRLNITPIEVEHGDITALGLRVAEMAYVPDVKTVQRADSLDYLRNLRVLVIDALREKSHPTHMNVREALAFIAEVRPQRAILTNMHVDLDFETLSRELPQGVEPGFDGMRLTLPDPT